MRRIKVILVVSDDLKDKDHKATTVEEHVWESEHYPNDISQLVNDVEFTLREVAEDFIK